MLPRPKSADSSVSSALSSTTTYFDDGLVEKTIASKSLSPYVLVTTASPPTPTSQQEQTFDQPTMPSQPQNNGMTTLINVPFSIPYLEVFIDRCDELPAMTNSGLCE